MSERRIVAGIDLETTGLEQVKGHRIIEFAAILHDLDTRQRLGKYVRRINPQRPVDADATKIHGITFEDLVSEPTWEEEAPKIASLLKMCRYAVVHNGEGFDVPFMYRELLRAGQPVPELFVVDTMLQGRWATPDGAIPNLGALCFASGVEYDKNKAHSAEYDVEVMLTSFFNQFDRGFFSLPSEPFKLQPIKEKT